MESRGITKKQESVSDKLLKLAKQRKLVKLIQFSKITVQKASQCSDLPIETTEIPESLGTIEGTFRNIDAMETTSNQTLKRRDSEMFLTRSEEILRIAKCSQSMEVGASLMQNELNILSIPWPWKQQVTRQKTQKCSLQEERKLLAQITVVSQWKLA